MYIAHDIPMIPPCLPPSCCPDCLSGRSIPSSSRGGTLRTGSLRFAFPVGKI